jgi:hypothetical protein
MKGHLDHAKQVQKSLSEGQKMGKPAGTTGGTGSGSPTGAPAPKGSSEPGKSTTK